MAKRKQFVLATPVHEPERENDMFNWLKQLDRILRGEATRLPALREGTIEIPFLGISAIIIILGLIYGLCMGCFAAMRGSEFASYEMLLGYVPAQLVATTLKVPALFFLTLVVTFPSLYVFNALVGSRLTVVPVLRLLIAALGVNLAVLASFGPITAFFSVCTTSYPFMILLNVVVFAAAGFLGLLFLLQTLHRLSIAQQEPPPVEPASGATEGEAQQWSQAPEEPGALDRLGSHVLGRHVKKVFYIWVVIFGLVGAQMGWVLRPFVGDPNLSFSWFRARESNFFQSVLESLRQLLQGG